MIVMGCTIGKGGGGWGGGKQITTSTNAFIVTSIRAISASLINSYAK